MTEPACPSGKVRHPDRDAASRQLRRLRSAAVRGAKVPCAVYRCQLCSGWHLTTRSRTQYLKWPGRRWAARRSA